MATFVLVPGAWLGGWCWKYVAPTLRDAGHEVYTPTLTGLGERAHLARPETDLETHITDVVNVLEYEELTDIILVGHSYAGLVVTGVIDRVPERVAHVVYLDAMTPMGAEATSVFDLAPPEYREMVEAEADERGEGWQWSMPEDPDGWVDISGSDARWLRSKAIPQPVGTFSQSVAARKQAAADLPSTYILCNKNGMTADGIEMIRDMANGQGWNLRELKTGHWPMVSMPDDVVELLGQSASTDGDDQPD